MKYNISDIGDKLIVDVTVSYNKFSTYLGKAYEMLCQQKNEKYESITEYIDKNGSQELDHMATNIALSDCYSTVMNENKILVIDEPKVHLKSTGFTTGTDTCFVFEITKAPEFELGQYKGLEIKVETPTPSVTTMEIEHAKKELTVRHITWEEVDGALENGQTAEIDFEGSVNGELFEGGSAQNFDLIIGSGMFIPGFEEQMVGMVKGETRIVKVRFPDQYAPELAGKDAEFKVTLHKIKTRKEPELSLEMIQDYGKEKGLTLNSEAELEDLLRKEIYGRKNQLLQKEIAEKLEDALYAGTKIDLPESGIEFEAQYQLNNYKAQAAQYGMEIDTFISLLGMKSVDDLLNEIREQARKGISLMLITNKIIDVEGLAVSDEELENHYNAYANAKGVSASDVKKGLPKAKLSEHVLTEKALKLVRDTAIITYA